MEARTVAKPKKKAAPKKKFFVWYTEYPDEGSLLYSASNAKAAEALARKEMADGDPETELTVMRATAAQAKAWEALP